MWSGYSGDYYASPAAVVWIVLQMCWAAIMGRM